MLFFILNCHDVLYWAMILWDYIWIPYIIFSFLIRLRHNESNVKLLASFIQHEITFCGVMVLRERTRI